MKSSEKSNGTLGNGGEASAQAGGGANGAKMKGVWTIIENEHREKSIWVRSGTAFVNRDDSLNVYLDVLPVNGKLHIRDIEPRQTAAA